MSLIAIGDIHGNLRALDDLLGKVTPEAGSGDTMVFLGVTSTAARTARGA